MKHHDRRQIAGWIAVGFSTLLTCFLEFWGIIENFHEGGRLCLVPFAAVTMS
jgi:hypothetical protein